MHLNSERLLRIQTLDPLIPALIYSKQPGVSKKHNPSTKGIREENGGEAVKYVIGCIVAG